MKNLIQMQFTLAGEKNVPHTTATLLRYCLDFPPQGGFTPSILKERARIDAKLDGVAVGATIDLEDADFATARKCAEDARWSVRHPDISKFLDLFGL